MALMKCSPEFKPVIQSNNEKEPPSLKFDILGNLPQEIAHKILFYLSIEDLQSAQCCCPSWKDIVRSDYFWKKLCNREGYQEVEDWSEVYNEKFFNRYNYWQGVYRYNDTVNRNWNTKNYNEVTYEIKEAYGSWRQWFLEDVFAVVSDDWDKLYVYNVKNKEMKRFVFPLRRESFHAEGIITKTENYLIYFVSKQSLTVWDLDNGSTVLNESWEHVTFLHADKNLFVLESFNERFEVFNIATSQIEYVYKEKFMNVVIMNGTIVFTSMDHFIHILKWQEKSLISLKCCNEKADNKLLVKDHILLSFCSKKDTSDVTLCVWNTKTKTKLHSILLESSRDIDFDSAIFVNNYLYLAKYSDMDGPHYSQIIELWDYMNGTREVQLGSDNNLALPNYSCISNDQVLIIYCESRVLVWSLKSQKVLDYIYVHPNDKYFSVGITKGKLAYSTGSPTDANCKSLYLHVRDYEI